MYLAIELDEDLSEDVQNIAILNGYVRVEDCVIALVASAVDYELRQLLKQYAHEKREKDNG